MRAWRARVIAASRPPFRFGTETSTTVQPSRAAGHDLKPRATSAGAVIVRLPPVAVITSSLAPASHVSPIAAAAPAHGQHGGREQRDAQAAAARAPGRSFPGAGRRRPHSRQYSCPSAAGARHRGQACHATVSSDRSCGSSTSGCSSTSGRPQLGQ